MAYLSGITNRLGKVTDGNTVSDYDKEEIKRKFSITTSVVPIEWGKVKINVLDTPGYFDFVGEVEEAVAAADAAIIVVSGKAGVQVGTQKAWEMCEKYNLPRMFFVTEMDFELVKNIGIRETGILVSCSDYHIFKKMNLTRKQAMEKYLGVISDAIEAGLHPRCHFEDITRADYYGFVVPFATELMKLSKDSGVPIKIRACDTMGYGISYPGVSLPRSVPGIIYGLKHYAGVPSDMLEWHGHNDFYKGVVNASTAWLYGAGAVNCSLLGIGERTGNVPLEAMVFEYASLRGDFDGMNPTVITEIAEYLEKETGYETPPMTPFVGRNFNLTRAGIHADGIMKDPEIYNIFDTELILNRPPMVAISNTSGLAGIAVWINQYYGLKGAEAIDKKNEGVVTIKELIDQEYANGRITVISETEMIRYAEQYVFHRDVDYEDK